MSSPEAPRLIQQIQVELPLPIFKSFTYQNETQDHPVLSVGSMVEVELGKRRMRGVVSAVSDHVEAGKELKSVIDCLPVSPLRGWQLRLADTLALQYFASRGEILGLFIPPYRPSWSELAEWSVFPGSVKSGDLRVNPQGRYLSLWKKEQRLRKPDIDRLIQEGTIVLERKRPGIFASRKVVPQSADRRWYSIPFREDRLAYLKEIAELCRATDQKALIVFPEVEALDRAVQFFQEQFPEIRLIRYDRRVTGQKRFLFFLKAEVGDYDIICGTHIACFLPLDQVSVHVIFDPEERGHGSERFPRYHSFQVLQAKSRLTGGMLAAVGLNPDMNLYHEIQEGRFFTHQFQSTRTPRSDRIIRSVVLDQKRKIFSMAARLALGNVLNRGQSALVWVQKSGYAVAWGCRDCGYYYSCPQCDVALRYSPEKNLLHCTLCGLRDDPQPVCPQCGGVWFDPWGYAVESVYEELRKGFPGADIRMMEKGGAPLSDRCAVLPQPGILVGTTAALIEPVLRASELVLLAWLDDWLIIPDLQARSRLFLLIKKILIYLGADIQPTPSLMVQSSVSFEKQIVSLMEPPSYFYGSELAKRKKIKYPPYAELLRLIVQGGNTEKRNRVCNWLIPELSQAGFSVYGPHPIAGSRKRGGISEEIIIHYLQDQHHKLYHTMGNLIPNRRKDGIEIIFEPL